MRNLDREFLPLTATENNYFDSSLLFFKAIEGKELLEIILKNGKESADFIHNNIEYKFNFISQNFYYDNCSIYYTFDNEKYLIRVSDHWSKIENNEAEIKTCGFIRACYWELDKTQMITENFAGGFVALSDGVDTDFAKIKKEQEIKNRKEAYEIRKEREKTRVAEAKESAKERAKADAIKREENKERDEKYIEFTKTNNPNNFEKLYRVVKINEKSIIAENIKTKNKSRFSIVGYKSYWYGNVKDLTSLEFRASDFSDCPGIFVGKVVQKMLCIESVDRAGAGKYRGAIWKVEKYRDYLEVY